MIHNADDLTVGRIVYLYPHTKTASQECHRQLTVSVAKDPKAHWPRVLVTWTVDGVDMWQMVHRDNIRLRRASSMTEKAEKTQGDSVGDKTLSVQRVRVLPKVKPLDPGDGVEELTLW